MGVRLEGLAPPPDSRLAWLLIPLTATLLLALVVFYVLWQTSVVEGDSMLPTLQASDRVLVTRDYDSPSSGDIVLLDLRGEAGRAPLIKRVVAVPGDEVRVEGDRIFVNGSDAVPYEILAGESAVSVEPFVLPEGSIYVAGDNRPVSLDSRFLGPVPLATVDGRVLAVFWPPARFGPIDASDPTD